MLTHVAHAQASPEAVVAVWADVAAWPAWDPELRAAELDGAFAPGTRGRLVPVRGRPSRFEITTVHPAGHTVDVALPLARLRLARSVAPEGAGARVEHMVFFDGPLGGVFARLLEPRFAHALPAAVAGVCARAEERAGARAAAA